MHVHHTLYIRYVLLYCFHKTKLNHLNAHICPTCSSFMRTCFTCDRKCTSHVLHNHTSGRSTAAAVGLTSRWRTLLSTGQLMLRDTDAIRLSPATTTRGAGPRRRLPVRQEYLYLLVPWESVLHHYGAHRPRRASATG